MKRAALYVDLANKSCVITSRRRFHGAWGPDITRGAVAAVIAVDGWRFRKNSTWTTTPDGGTRPVERPGVVRRLVERVREALAVRVSDRTLNNLGSATPTANDRLGAVLLAWRNEVEEQPIPELVDTPTAADTIHKGETA